MEKKFDEFGFYDVETGLWLDFAALNMPEGFFESKKAEIAKSLALMAELEAGSIANPDENRMVGHYWLRNAALAPNEEISDEIEKNLQDINDFVERIHGNDILSSTGKPYKHLVVIGIGGSALGTRFVSEALGLDLEPMTLYFVDNTDPAGMDRIFMQLEDVICQTLVLVISKSGGTVETRNGMLEMENFFNNLDVDFWQNTVCITQEGSKLDLASPNALAKFKMWDWVGGRTSIFSAVGILPLALQGLNVQALLNGAAMCDELTRSEFWTNPAAQLALAWLYETGGKGGTSMVMLPYKDQLEGLSKYLQQLIMESLGKELDLDGKPVHQGLAVYGNKGSSDQHSYVQQLVAGSDKMFVSFVSALNDRNGKSPKLDCDSTAGEYLNAFMLGTERNLASGGKDSLTIAVPKVNEFYIGMLIALFERTVGLYANLVNINAYHQPAVEAGKVAAAEIIDLKNDILAHMRQYAGIGFTANELAESLQVKDQRLVLKLLMHLTFNGYISKKEASTLAETSFVYEVVVF